MDGWMDGWVDGWMDGWMEQSLQQAGVSTALLVPGGFSLTFGSLPLLIQGSLGRGRAHVRDVLQGVPRGRWLERFSRCVRRGPSTRGTLHGGVIGWSRRCICLRGDVVLVTESPSTDDPIVALWSGERPPSLCCSSFPFLKKEAKMLPAVVSSGPRVCGVGVLSSRTMESGASVTIFSTSSDASLAFSGFSSVLPSSSPGPSCFPTSSSATCHSSSGVMFVTRLYTGTNGMAVRSYRGMKKQALLTHSPEYQGGRPYHVSIVRFTPGLRQHLLCPLQSVLQTIHLEQQRLPLELQAPQLLHHLIVALLQVQLETKCPLISGQAPS
ncbi:hypothetical protein JZ751_018029 [Albula glossodonta]|uniref:Uncharacterized protein n=1 Tax=Albula glossodonta TaxID=121402 RepID=A0A8T2PQ13_9TELE|nr:hypothetical protein JZ751_018029 [Albula glossodonta]